jgi:hypothetical protein
VIAGYRRTSRSLRCPICGKPNWCIVSDDGSKAICQRVASDRRCKDAGWLHVVDGQQPRTINKSSTKAAAGLTRAQLEILAQQAATAINPFALSASLPRWASPSKPKRF